jgi:predicted peptidase
MRRIFTLLFMLFCVTATAQDAATWLTTIKAGAIRKGQTPKPGFALYFTKVGTEDVPYLVYVPKGYDPRKPNAMTVFLHGAILAREHFMYGDPAIAKEPAFLVADELNVVVVFPFGRSGLMWPSQTAALDNITEIVKQVREVYNVDAERTFLGGISMGGSGTFWFITHRPELFAGFYTFSALPHQDERFSNISIRRPLYSLNAKDDPNFSYDDVHRIYETHKQEAPGWHFGSVETGGHRFIYADGGEKYVKEQLQKLLGTR